MYVCIVYVEMLFYRNTIEHKQPLMYVCMYLDAYKNLDLSTCKIEDWRLKSLSRTAALPFPS